jgi:hypothetical protein
VVGFRSSVEVYGFAQIKNANFAFDWHLLRVVGELPTFHLATKGKGKRIITQ